MRTIRLTKLTLIHCALLCFTVQIWAQEPPDTLSNHVIPSFVYPFYIPKTPRLFQTLIPDHSHISTGMDGYNYSSWGSVFNGRTMQNTFSTKQNLDIKLQMYEETPATKWMQIVGMAAGAFMVTGVVLQATRVRSTDPYDVRIPSPRPGPLPPDVPKRNDPPPPPKR